MLNSRAAAHERGHKLVHVRQIQQPVVVHVREQVPARERADKRVQIPQIEHAERRRQIRDIAGLRTRQPNSTDRILQQQNR